MLGSRVYPSAKRIDVLVEAKTFYLGVLEMTKMQTYNFVLMEGREIKGGYVVSFLERPCGPRFISFSYGIVDLVTFLYYPVTNVEEATYPLLDLAMMNGGAATAYTAFRKMERIKTKGESAYCSFVKEEEGLGDSLYESEREFLSMAYYATIVGQGKDFFNIRNSNQVLSRQDGYYKLLAFLEQMNIEVKNFLGVDATMLILKKYSPGVVVTVLTASREANEIANIYDEGWGSAAGESLDSKISNLIRAENFYQEGLRGDRAPGPPWPRTIEDMESLVNKYFLRQESSGVTHLWREPVNLRAFHTLAGKSLRQLARVTKLLGFV